MQVNNNSSMNFGALKIKPEAAEYLKEQSRSSIELITKIGEELKDTKIFNLVIGEKGKRIIESPYANKYYGETFRIDKPHNQFLTGTAKWAGEDIGNAIKEGENYNICIDLLSKDAAIKEYAKLRTMYGIEKDAEIVKLLDQSAVRRMEKETQAKAEKKNVEEMVSNLMGKFGV